MKTRLLLQLLGTLAIAPVFAIPYALQLQGVPPAITSKTLRTLPDVHVAIVPHSAQQELGQGRLHHAGFGQNAVPLRHARWREPRGEYRHR
jgi:hypothetical protein